MHTAFQFPALSDYARLKLMRRAEAAFHAQQQVIAHGGAHALMLQFSGYDAEKDHVLRAPATGFVSGRHYPRGDRIDFAGGGQYYYHCHRENLETEEHGHFHCFIRKSGWPKSWRLARIPEHAKFLDIPMTHLVAIGLNRRGMPVRLFMVNRWVARESWFDAAKMQRMVRRFNLTNVKQERPNTGDQAPEWRLVDAWVENLVHLFMPQICWLYGVRDAEMAQYVAAAGEGGNPYLDKSIEELGSIDISLEAQIAWLTGVEVC